MPENNMLEEQKLEYKKFCEDNGIYSSEAFNQKLREGNARGLIEVCEKRHSEKIESISCEISQKDRCRIVCVSGPSSSAKTTFAQRLKTSAGTKRNNRLFGFD